MFKKFRLKNTHSVEELYEKYLKILKLSNEFNNEQVNQ